MALATDHRPAKLEDLAGNVTLKKTLKSKLSLSNDRRPHVYLFTGPKGCGKTTLGRIVSSYLNCASREFTEIDASDESGGVSAIRELKRTIRYPPMEGNVRIWFIDECHLVTGKGQEAFLKMLEEPPAYAYFVLATTDPQKLTKTLKDRCVTFEVQPLSNKEMEDFLYDIIDKEGIDVPDKVVRRLVDGSGGHPRAALQMLERIADLSQNDMLKAVEQVEETEVQVIDLCRALLNKKSTWAEIAPLIKNLTGEPESCRWAILGYCNSVLLQGKENAKAALIMDCFSKNFFDTGKNGLTLAAYQVFFG